MNSLVTQNSQYVSQNHVMGHCVLLAYIITGIWMGTVVLMIIINKAKRRGNDRKWCVVYQAEMFRYLRLLSVLLLLLYAPLLSAYNEDKGNGRQTRSRRGWILCACFYAFIFIITLTRDYRNMQQAKSDVDEDSTKARNFSNKPLNQLTREEVLCWVRRGSMKREAYFSESKRALIAKMLEAACVDGELLVEYGGDIEKLVQLVGLTLGDAARLSEELERLPNNNNKVSSTDANSKAKRRVSTATIFVLGEYLSSDVAQYIVVEH